MTRFSRFLTLLRPGLWLLASFMAHAEPVRFSLAAPGAQEVFLAGEMTRWKPASGR
jgi:hypothetical protein